MISKTRLFCIVLIYKHDIAENVEMYLKPCKNFIILNDYFERRILVYLNFHGRIKPEFSMFNV